MRKLSKAEEAQFKTLVADCHRAWDTLKPENAAPFYAKDGGLVFYDMAPLKYVGWRGFERGTRKMLSTIKSARIKLGNDFRVVRTGNIAVTTVTFGLTAKPLKGKTWKSPGRHTAVWEKRGNKWLIIHDHWSAPLPPAP